MPLTEAGEDGAVRTITLDHGRSATRSQKDLVEAVVQALECFARPCPRFVGR